MCFCGFTSVVWGCEVSCMMAPFLPWTEPLRTHQMHAPLCNPAAVSQPKTKGNWVKQVWARLVGEPLKVECEQQVASYIMDTVDW